ncbi:MAG TPA: PD-(D/E)XK nuclease family protein, partial [Gemmatimonadaceae bacterium]|nr:PD-(D/E)XK nuclease family protein [Gemmatimonadaceae bacterium]
DAVARIFRVLRRNDADAERYRAAGGDARVADAFARYESRRRALGLSDEADRVRRLIAAGIPPVSLVVEDLAVGDCLTLELFRAVVASSSSIAIGVPNLAEEGSEPAIAQVLRELGFDVALEGEPPARPTMSAIGGAGTHDEAELVARQALARLRASNPVRASDILVVAPNEQYLTLAHDALVALGVPIASPRRLPALDVPLVATLLRVFHALANPRDDAAESGLALLATPYCGLGVHRHPRAARALIRAGRGSLRSWVAVAAEEPDGSSFRRLAEAVPKLADSLRATQAPASFARVVRQLALDYRFISSGRRFHLAAQRDDAVRVDQQGWQCLGDAMDEVGAALERAGMARVDAAAWHAEVTAALAEADVRVEAKGCDGVRLTVTGAGLTSAAHVFALGWREGLVPRRVREDPLLPDRVKERLNESGAMLTLAADRVEIERERRERIVRASRESLVVSWPATGEQGESVLPSFYMEDLGIAVARDGVRGAGDTTWPLPLAATRAERVTRATMLAKHRPESRLGAERDGAASILSGFARRELECWDGMRAPSRTVKVPGPMRDELAPLAGAMSASQAKMLVHCAFSHFGVQRIGAKPLLPPALDPLSIGGIIHGVLARLGRELSPAALDEVFAAEWQRRMATGFGTDPSEPMQREILLDQLRDLVASEHARLAGAAAKPAHIELSFGMPDGKGEIRDAASRPEGVELRLPDGAPIPATVLRGSIDRVDVLERGGRRYGVAFDYKSGRGERYLDETHDLADFQLPIYCEALRTFGIEPVGAVYIGVRDAELHGVVREDFATEFGLASIGTVAKLPEGQFAGYMSARSDALRTHVVALARGEIVVEP